jgi:hypothetical protein
MAEKIPRKPTGSFQWNTAGWFGTQFGCTLWVLILGWLASFYNISISLLVVCFFIVPNIIGFTIWYRRDHFFPYPAIQYLIISISVFAFLTLITLDSSGLATQIDEQFGNSYPYFYLVLLLFPVLMMQLHYQNKSTGGK